jgi:hypothetical protein
MDENKREEIALFRYGLILPFLTPDELEWGVKGEMRKRLAQQPYNIPHSSKHTIDEETIRKWLANYKANGFDGLKPKGRNDAGKVRKLSPEAWEKAVALKKEVPARSVRKIIQIMEAHQMIQPGEIKPSTLARQFHAHGLDRKTLSRQRRDKTFRRFEAERPNQIWQSDILYGPYLPDPNQPEKNKRTYLVAFIDDFSRLVPHAEFYWDEKFPTLENTFKIAMLKRGMPEIIYVDNGKVYHARQLDAVCASLGIRKISCQPYSPEGKTREIILCHSLFIRKLLLSHVSRAKSSAFSEPCAKTFSKSRRPVKCKRCPSSTNFSGPGWKWIISSAFTAAPASRRLHAGAITSATFCARSVRKNCWNCFSGK